MYDVIIIGSGPSGLMAGINASKKYNNVLVLEKNDKLALKLLASGNGRCNVTNLKSNMDFLNEITCDNKKFILSSLSEFGPYDIVDFFESRNCILKEETDEKMFPASDNSQDILNVLLEELKNNKVKISTKEQVEEITKEDEVFTIQTNLTTYKSTKVVLAAGGKSYPALGTTGDGYRFLESFGLKINQPTPALVPLNSNLKLIVDKTLQGTTLENVVVTHQNKSFQGNVLLTHFGVTGPAIFRISEFVNETLLTQKEAVIKIDVIPNYTEEELLEKAFEFKEKQIQTLFKGLVFEKVAKEILKDVYNKKISQIDKKTLINIINKFKQFNMPIYDNKGFKSAFVTKGGLDLKEVNPKTLEVKKVPGLHVCGELLDIHGPTGGYNITIALATGYKVGNNV